MEKFEDIKNKFIVDEAKYPKEKLTSLMNVLFNFVRVSKDGQVVVVKQVPTRKVLPLILSARFIANKVENEIDEWMTRDELMEYSYLKKEVFTARFNELLREGMGDKKDEKIKAKNILLVERFLKQLEEKK